MPDFQFKNNILLASQFPFKFSSHPCLSSEKVFVGFGKFSLLITKKKVFQLLSTVAVFTLSFVK